MKISKIALLILAIALALYILVPSLSWAAEDGAACRRPKAQRDTLMRIPLGLGEVAR